MGMQSRYKLESDKGNEQVYEQFDNDDDSKKNSHKNPSIKFRGVWSTSYPQSWLLTYYKHEEILNMKRVKMENNYHMKWAKNSHSLSFYIAAFIHQCRTGTWGMYCAIQASRYIFILIFWLQSWHSENTYPGPWYDAISPLQNEFSVWVQIFTLWRVFYYAYAHNTFSYFFLILQLDSHNSELHVASHLSRPVPEPMSRTVLWPFLTALVIACLKAAFLPASLSIGRCQRSTREFASLPWSSWA